jgi:hypothetical protein
LLNILITALDMKTIHSIREVKKSCLSAIRVFYEDATQKLHVKTV